MVQRLDCRIIKFLCRHCAAFSFCREVVKLAATRLIALHKNKGKSVAACLKSRTDYAQNPDKTQQGELVSSYECSPLTVDEEFMLSKRQYELVTGRRQKSDVIAYQIRQSFKPGEITAEEANKVGYELAMRFTKGKAFVAATNRAGLSLNYDSMQLSDYRIGCVGTALKLYDQLGEEIYCEALRHIVAAWEGRPDSFRAAVLRGVMYFVQLYHGQYSAERLVRALSGVHPMELYRISRDNPAKLPGWRRYVYPIYTTYNGKCRKDALPMKF